MCHAFRLEDSWYWSKVLVISLNNVGPEKKSTQNWVFWFGLDQISNCESCHRLHFPIQWIRGLSSSALSSVIITGHAKRETAQMIHVNWENSARNETLAVYYIAPIRGRAFDFYHIVRVIWAKYKLTLDSCEVQTTMNEVTTIVREHLGCQQNSCLQAVLA